MDPIAIMTAAVYDDPNDLGARAALADLLEEQGKDREASWHRWILKHETIEAVIRKADEHFGFALWWCVSKPFLRCFDPPMSQFGIYWKFRKDAERELYKKWLGP